MHIAFVMPPNEIFDERTGGAIAAVCAARGRQLSRCGDRVHVISPGPLEVPYTGLTSTELLYPPQLSFLQKAVERIKLGMYRYDWWAYGHYRRGVFAALAMSRPDVVVLNNDFRLARLLRRRLGVRVSLLIHNEFTPRAPWLRPSSGLNSVISISEYLSAWFRRTHPDAAELRHHVVRSGVDVDTFRRALAAEGSTRASRELKVLYLGRVHPSKGADLAVDAALEVARRGVAIRFTLAGGVWFGSHDPATDQYYRHLSERVNAVGWTVRGHVPRSEVPALLANHDVVLVPSRVPEGLSLVAMEAMAAGCAVIATMRGGLPEAVGNGGILVAPEVDSIASALGSLANPAELTDWQARASMRATELDWSASEAEFRSALL